MPELPEVETIVQELQPLLKHKLIEKIKILWPRTVNNNETSIITALTNKRIIHVQRRGKFICIELDSKEILTIHLRMTGKLVFQPTEKECKHIRVIFAFHDGVRLYFVDARKFGRMQLWPADLPLLPQLGPEPLAEKSVFDALSVIKSRRPIKTILLDQEVLAGIGNIYANEALFCAGIHPLTPANAVSKAKLKKLSHYIPEILLAAIKNKGTTISDYRRTDRQEGNNQLFLQVYGRYKLECPRCHTLIDYLKINSRGSHFCPRCQPKNKFINNTSNVYKK